MAGHRRTRGFAPDGFNLPPYGRMDKTQMQSKTVQALMTFMKEVYSLKLNNLDEVKVEDLNKAEDLRDAAHIMMGYWSLCKTTHDEYGWRDKREEQLEDMRDFGKEELNDH